MPTLDYYNDVIHYEVISQSKGTKANFNGHPDTWHEEELPSCEIEITKYVVSVGSDGNWIETDVWPVMKNKKGVADVLKRTIEAHEFKMKSLKKRLLYA